MCIGSQFDVRNAGKRNPYLSSGASGTYSGVFAAITGALGSLPGVFVGIGYKHKGVFTALNIVYLFLALVENVCVLLLCCGWGLYYKDHIFLCMSGIHSLFRGLLFCALAQHALFSVS